MSWYAVGSALASVVASQMSPKGGASSGTPGSGPVSGGGDVFKNMIPMLGGQNGIADESTRGVSQGPFVGAGSQNTIDSGMPKVMPNGTK